MNEEIYKFCWDYGKHGCVTSVFLAKPSEILELIGQTVYFGDILGNHSNVEGVVEESDITKVLSDFEFNRKCLEVFGKTICGPNPIDNVYLKEEE